MFKNPWAKGGEYYPEEVLGNRDPLNNSSVIYKGVLFNNVIDTNSTSSIDIDQIEVKNRKDIIIVIDPGHGNTTGNTGSVYIKSYKHKVKGLDGKPEKELNGTDKIIESTIPNLPDYVIKEITKEKAEWIWITQRIYDNDKTERDIVWTISNALKDILTQSYNVYLTRENKIINGADNRNSRISFANGKKAHYFISIHADGSYNFAISGSHAIYREGSSSEYNQRQQQFATDIFSGYSVVSKHNSPRIRNDLQVISANQNNVPRKVLLELGFVTNPNDFNALNNNANLVANQIARGIENNITKVFYILRKTTSYLFLNKKYPNMESAFNARKKYLIEQENAREHLKKKYGIDGMTGASVIIDIKPIVEETKEFLKTTINPL